MNGLILKAPAKITGRVEISRSFSFKLNVGNFESRDFFMSQRAECEAEEAEEISELLYQFVKSQVLKSVREYQENSAAQFAPEKARRAS